MRWIAAGGAVLAVAALAAVTSLYLNRAVPDLLPARFDISTPPTGDPLSLAFSFDGRQLAFVATADGGSKLLVRTLDQVVPQTLAGTDGASYPFWSPNGRSIGFFAAGKLKRLDLGSGEPLVLADAPTGRGGTWNRDGIIVFAPSTASTLMRIPAAGGPATPVTRLSSGQNSHRWPQFLPDGRHFLFLSTQGSAGIQGVLMASLDDDEPSRVLEDDVAPVFAPPDLLLTVRQGALVALRYDTARNLVLGEPIQVVQRVGFDTSIVRGAYAVSETGQLAYRTTMVGPRQLVWVDRTGTVQGGIGPPDDGAIAGPELALDGRRLATFRTVDGNTDVWLTEVSRGVQSRFTFHERPDIFPVWSSDGRRVLFSSGRKSSYDLYDKSVDGTGDNLLFQSSELKLPMSVSSDGRFLLYADLVPQTGVDLLALPLVGDRKPFPVVQTAFDDMAGQFSPSGRSVAYQTNASGHLEVYVRPFPSPGGELQVSSAGGSQPRWRRDGKELFYVANDGRLMAVPIRIGPDGSLLEAGVAVALFPTRLATGTNVLPSAGSRAQYAVGNDGRFLMNVPVEGAPPPPITVLLNWQATLRN